MTEKNSKMPTAVPEYVKVRGYSYEEILQKIKYYNKGLKTVHFEFLTPTLLRFYVFKDSGMFDITSYISFLFDLPYNQRFKSLHINRNGAKEFFNDLTVKISELLELELSFEAVKN